MTRDIINTVATKVEDGDWEIAVERSNANWVGDDYSFNIETGGEWYDMGDEFEVYDEFCEKYNHLFIGLQKAVDEYPDRSTVQLWEMGRVLDGEEFTKEKLENLHPSDKVRNLEQAEAVYELFPNGTDGDLPERENASTFLNLCLPADNKKEVLEFEREFEEAGDKYNVYDIRAWNAIKDEDPEIKDVVIEVESRQRDRDTDRKAARAIVRLTSLCCDAELTIGEATEQLRTYRRD